MMTEEQKQALVSRCEKHLELYRKIGFTGLAEEECAEIFAIALAALTQPASPALKLPWSENTCRECGSKSLSWSFAIINNSTVQNGLLRISDVDGLFYLGCDECSETVTRISPDEVVELLSALQQSINAPHTAPIEPICATGGAEWVKVSERMPEACEPVIVVNHGIDVYPAVFYDGKFYEYGDTFPPCLMSNPTHWMPLPAEPKP